MPLPAGITTATVTFGKAHGVLGTEATITGTVALDRPIVWAATGDMLYTYGDPVSSGPGNFLSFQFPHVDQPGFVDEGGNAVTNFAGILKARVTFGKQYFDINKSFQVFAGQSSIDLDLVPGGSIVPGVTAPSAAVLSVAGETGVVDAEHLKNAIGAMSVTELETVLPAKMTNPADPVGGALSASIAAQLGDVADPANVAGQLTEAAARVAAEAAVAAELDRRLDLVSLVAPGTLVSHRGGRSTHPENSLLGFQYAQARGWVGEIDLVEIAGGVLVVNHDDTSGRTLTGPDVPFATMSLADYKSRRIKPAINMPNSPYATVGNFLIEGMDYTAPMTWDEWLNLFGGKWLSQFETKAAMTEAGWKSAIDDVAARGLGKSLIHLSFEVTHIEYALSKGITTAYLTNNATVAYLQARGIALVSTAMTTPPALVEAWQAAGIKVIIYTPNTPADFAAARARNPFMILSDDPGWVSNDFPQAERTRFREWRKGLPPGTRWFNGSPTLANDRLENWRDVAANSTAVRSVTLRELLPVDMSGVGYHKRIQTTLHFQTAVGSSGQGTGGGFFVGSLVGDATFTNVAGAGQVGVVCRILRSGQMNLYGVADGAAPTSIAQGASAAVAAAGATGSVPIEVAFSTVEGVTTATFTRRDTGASISANVTPYVRSAGRVAATAQATHVQFDDFTLAP